MRRFFLVLGVIIAVIVVSGIVWFFNSEKSVTHDELEVYILGKLTSEEVFPGYTPVLIYTHLPEKEEGRIAGSGTLFEGKNGIQLITAAHIFHEDLGSPHYLIRRLRPLESIVGGVEHGIESINDTGINITGFENVGTDVVMCKVGKKTQSIQALYNKDRERAESNLTFTTWKTDSPYKIRSLVSGQEAIIIGQSDLLSNGVGQYLTTYQGRAGESGTGFVDTKGNLFVLKAIVVDNNNPSLKRSTMCGAFHRR